jgi:hypothetical protein
MHSPRWRFYTLFLCLPASDSWNSTAFIERRVCPHKLIKGWISGTTVGSMVQQEINGGQWCRRRGCYSSDRYFATLLAVLSRTTKVNALDSLCFGLVPRLMDDGHPRGYQRGDEFCKDDILWFTIMVCTPGAWNLSCDPAALTLTRAKNCINSDPRACSVAQGYSRCFLRGGPGFPILLTPTSCQDRMTYLRLHTSDCATRAIWWARRQHFARTNADHGP